MRARPKIVYAGEFQCKNGVVTRISADRVCPEEEVFSGEFTEKTMLVGDCAAEIKAKYFADNENVQACKLCEQAAEGFVTVSCSGGSA